MLKQNLKTINAEFIQTSALSQLFFSPVQTVSDLIPRASSLFDVNAKRQKDPGDKFGPYAFVQDLL